MNVSMYEIATYGFGAYAALFGICKIINRVWIRGGICQSDARLDGKTVVITGSNTGIGKQTAVDLASRGASVIMACRSKARTLPAVKEVIEASGNTDVNFRELDVSSLTSVRSFVEAFDKDQDRLDILVNNAGIMAAPQTKSGDGFELQMATNHLGHFLLTNLLLPKLKAAPKARIVNVSSIMHEWAGQKIDPDNLMMEKNYDRWLQYGNSKMANVLFTKELSRRLVGTRINAYALHPGVVDTELLRNLVDTFFIKLVFNWAFRKLTPILYFYKSSQEGAQTSIYCSVSEDCKNETGLYYSDCAVKQPAPVANDARLAERLWIVSEKLVGLP